MGTTESILDYGEESVPQPPTTGHVTTGAGTAHPSHLQRSPPPPRTNRRRQDVGPVHSSKSVGISQQESPKHSSSTKTRPRAVPPKPIHRLCGLVVGGPQTGKRTLLQRLQGLDPFANDHDASSNSDRRTSTATTHSEALVTIPYRPPNEATAWDRIQLQVRRSRDIDTTSKDKLDFMVLLVKQTPTNNRGNDTDQDPNSIDAIQTILKTFLHQLGYPDNNNNNDDDGRSNKETRSNHQEDDTQSSLSRPVCICILTNFRDLHPTTPSSSSSPNKDFVPTKQELNSLVTSLCQTMNVPQDKILFQMISTSLRNCYGLNILHNFVYQTYLIQKQAALEEQIQALSIQRIKTKNETDKLLLESSYQDFLKWLPQEQDAAVPSSSSSSLEQLHSKVQHHVPKHKHSPPSPPMARPNLPMHNKSPTMQESSRKPRVDSHPPDSPPMSRQLPLANPSDRRQVMMNSGSSSSSNTARGRLPPGRPPPMRLDKAALEAFLASDSEEEEMETQKQIITSSKNKRNKKTKVTPPVDTSDDDSDFFIDHDNNDDDNDDDDDDDNDNEDNDDAVDNHSDSDNEQDPKQTVQRQPQHKDNHRNNSHAPIPQGTDKKMKSTTLDPASTGIPTAAAISSEVQQAVANRHYSGDQYDSVGNDEDSDSEVDAQVHDKHDTQSKNISRSDEKGTRSRSHSPTATPSSLPGVISSSKKDKPVQSNEDITLPSLSNSNSQTEKVTTTTAHEQTEDYDNPAQPVVVRSTKAAEPSFEHGTTSSPHPSPREQQSYASNPTSNTNENSDHREEEDDEDDDYMIEDTPDIHNDTTDTIADSQLQQQHQQPAKEDASATETTVDETSPTIYAKSSAPSPPMPSTTTPPPSQEQTIASVTNSSNSVRDEQVDEDEDDAFMIDDTSREDKRTSMRNAKDGNTAIVTDMPTQQKGTEIVNEALPVKERTVESPKPRDNGSNDKNDNNGNNNNDDDDDDDDEYFIGEDDGSSKAYATTAKPVTSTFPQKATYASNSTSTSQSSSMVSSTSSVTSSHPSTGTGTTGSGLSSAAMAAILAAQEAAEAMLRQTDNDEGGGGGGGVTSTTTTTPTTDAAAGDTSFYHGKVKKGKKEKKSKKEGEKKKKKKEKKHKKETRNVQGDGDDSD